MSTTHVQRAVALHQEYDKLITVARELTWDEHRVAEGLLIEISGHQARAALAAGSGAEARRWSWAATRTRDRAEFHALAAHLILMAATIALTEQGWAV